MALRLRCEICPELAVGSTELSLATNTAGYGTCHIQRLAKDQVFEDPECFSFYKLSCRDHCILDLHSSGT